MNMDEGLLALALSAAKDQIAVLEEDLAQRDAEIERLKAPRQRDNEILALRARIADLESQQAASAGGDRDREADRAVFTDPLFNKWLDEPITENGEYTVWHQVGDTGAAWHGWENRQFYVDQEYAELRARAALSPAGDRVVE